jgi:hypothetical protein
LEGWREDRNLGHAAGVSVGQRREETERGNNSDKEKRQNRHEVHGISGMLVRDQQQQERKADCDCRNQKYSAPLLDRFHR